MFLNFVQRYVNCIKSRLNNVIYYKCMIPLRGHLRRRWGRMSARRIDVRAVAWVFGRARGRMLLIQVGEPVFKLILNDIM